MSIKSLQDYVFTSKYSHYLPKEKCRETFEEAIDRVIDMHSTHFSSKGVDVEDLLDECRQAMKKRMVLGSQRAMQFGGNAVLRKNARLYNCTTSYCDRPKFFQEALWLLLCGCGVGFSVQRHHISQLPPVSLPTSKPVLFIIPDTIEGWADALGALLSSYFDADQPFPEYANRSVMFDYSEIRPRGAPISTGIGRAPGPEPLKIALEHIRTLLNKCCEKRSKLRPIDAYDIMMFASDAVLSGGVRRSASICLFSPEDEEMAKAKTGNWLTDNPQRARSNNSAMLLRDSTTREQFSKLMESVKEFGEPGFVWTDDLEATFNPCCVTGDTWVHTDEGPRQVIDLVGKKFTAIVDGKPYKTISEGFWKTGEKFTIELCFKEGHKIRVTPDHRIKTESGEWVEAGNLKIGNKVKLSNHGEYHWDDCFPLQIVSRHHSREEKDFTAELVYVKNLGTGPVYDVAIEDVHEFCANGIQVHNCEIGLYPTIENESGFAFCNLCEINMGIVDTPEKFKAACRVAAILGTLQADYTNFGYLDKASEKIAKREALLGISMTGMMENPVISFNPVLQRKMAQYILEVNEEVAKRIGINPTARATCVKPAGTTSCILGTSSGIHPHHAKRYFRRAQAAFDEPLVDFFRKHNPRAVEPSVWSASGTDVSLIFRIEAKENALTKRDVDAISLLERVKLTKENWIDYGKNTERCAQPWLSHNVSNTISVKDNEWDEVEKFIFDNRAAFAGISLLPEGGDLDYPQAPFCEILTEKQIVDIYGVGAMFASGLIVDGLHAFNDNLWAACDCALGRGEDLSIVTSNNKPKRVHEALEQVRLAKVDWVRRAKKFADNYFDGNVLKMTRCLKRVSSVKQWEDLTRTHKDVDYTMLVEEEDNTELTDTVACAGGACEII